MATETDAARERVLVARAQLGDELVALEASARSAVDIPAKIKRSPAKAAAVAGTAGFLVLGGPRRVAGGVRRVFKGPKAPMPKSMLPDEIEKALKHLGSDGDKVRGALERDFADYTKKAARNRTNLRNLLALAIARPLLLGGSKATAKWLFADDQETFDERLAKIRERIGEVVEQGREVASSVGDKADAEPAVDAKPAASAPAKPAASAPAKPADSAPAKPRTGSLRDDTEDDSGA